MSTSTTHESEEKSTATNFAKWICDKTADYAAFCADAFPCKYTFDMCRFLLPDLVKVGAPVACMYLYVDMIEKYEGKPDEWVSMKIEKHFVDLFDGKVVTESEKEKLKKYHMFFDKALDIHFNEMSKDSVKEG